MNSDITRNFIGRFIEMRKKSQTHESVTPFFDLFLANIVFKNYNYDFRESIKNLPCTKTANI